MSARYLSPMRICTETQALIDAERSNPLSLISLPALEGAKIDEGVSSERFGLTSRGDRVPLMIWQPRGQPKAPLVVFQYGLGGCVDHAHLETVRQLVGCGLSVATVDWTLHGARFSPKLSERLVQAATRNKDHPNDMGLVRQFMGQSALDLSRALDGVEKETAIPTDRVALLGLGWSGALMTLLATVDPRPATLLLAGAPRPAPERFLDVPQLLTQIRPSSVQWLTSDLSTSEAASWKEALQSACPGSFSCQQATDGVEPLSATAREKACAFLRSELLS